MRTGSRDWTVGQALRRLEGAQKQGVGTPAYTRWVNRRLARYAAVAAYRLGLTPDVVSWLSFATSVTGLVTLVVAPPFSPMVGVVVAMLLAVGFVLDSADGQLARLTGTSGPAGEWLDHVLDAIRSPAVHLCVLVVALTTAGSPSWLAAAAFIFTLTQVGQFSSQMLGGMLLDRTAGPRTPPRRHQSWILLPTDTGVMCWIFVLWGWPRLFAGAYLIVLVLAGLLAAVSMRRRWRELRQVKRESSAQPDLLGRRVRQEVGHRLGVGVGARAAEDDDIPGRQLDGQVALADPVQRGAQGAGQGRP